MFILLQVFLKLLSETSFVKIIVKVTFLGPFASRRRPFGSCEGYFLTTQWQVEGWSVGLL